MSQVNDNGCGACDADGCNLEQCSEDKRLAQRLKQIRQICVVLSGKGGVGKSTVAGNLAASLAKAGFKTGLLDVDVHGPSIPQLFKLHDVQLTGTEQAINPVYVSDRLHVMSVAFMLSGDDVPVIWRGPMKTGVIKQLLTDVNWGELDYLIIDSPPGTGDEPLSVCQLLPDAGAVVVSTPQEMALADVRRSVNFCKQVDLNVLGVIENMSGFVCPSCGERTDILKKGGAQKMAHDLDLHFLGDVPFDTKILQEGDEGVLHLVNAATTSVAAASFRRIVDRLLERAPLHKSADDALADASEAISRRYAVPLADGQLAMHFGHCEQFALIDVTGDEQLSEPQLETPPPHEPGLLPRWLNEKGVTHIIAGGMGNRAQALFSENGIEVITGAPVSAPEILVKEHLASSLQTGPNACAH